MEVQGDAPVPHAPGWWPSRTELVIALMGMPMTMMCTWFAKGYNLGDIHTFATGPTVMAACSAIMLLLGVAVALHAVAWRVAPHGKAWHVKNALIFMAAGAFSTWWFFSRLSVMGSNETTGTGPGTGTCGTGTCTATGTATVMLLQ